MKMSEEEARKLINTSTFKEVCGYYGLSYLKIIPYAYECLIGTLLEEVLIDVNSPVKIEGNEVEVPHCIEEEFSSLEELFVDYEDAIKNTIMSEYGDILDSITSCRIYCDEMEDYYLVFSYTKAPSEKVIKSRKAINTIIIDTYEKMPEFLSKYNKLLQDNKATKVAEIHKKIAELQEQLKELE